MIVVARWCCWAGVPSGSSQRSMQPQRNCGMNYWLASRAAIFKRASKYWDAFGSGRRKMTVARSLRASLCLAFSSGATAKPNTGIRFQQRRQFPGAAKGSNETQHGAHGYQDIEPRRLPTFGETPNETDSCQQSEDSEMGVPAFHHFGSVCHLSNPSTQGWQNDEK